MIHTLVSLILSALVMAVFAAPITVRPATVSYILSEETRRFLTFSADGEVSANGDIGKLSYLYDLTVTLVLTLQVK